MSRLTTSRKFFKVKSSTTLFGAIALWISEVVAFPAAAIEYAAKAERDAPTTEQLSSAVDGFLKNRATQTSTQLLNMFPPTANTHMLTPLMMTDVVPTRS
ncbi:hypothetical protein B0J14DRAFT_650378 [Halenospora varia]|nr:hypothetical protein B0J14DRAFT_650378 [Halenospora varia]